MKVMQALIWRIKSPASNRAVRSWKTGAVVHGFFPRHPLSECDERFVDDNGLVPRK